MKNGDYKQKFIKHIQNTQFLDLSTDLQQFISQKASHYKFTFQELKQIVTWSIDLHMWGQNNVKSIWPTLQNDNLKTEKKLILKELELKWTTLKSTPVNYIPKSEHTLTKKKSIFVQETNSDPILGRCPVASPKTRCCNLLTLDAVKQCGLGCSYCSIQSFYSSDKVIFDENFKDKLENIIIDPNQKYHIGTGQSSDSLMWGNRFEMLGHLIKFAKDHPNVVLEFKSKSKNIDYLLDQTLPRNMIFTWSLNPQTVIDNEEHLTASLKDRIESAKQIAKKGNLIGFHFHPMIFYKNWQNEYRQIVGTILETFTHKEIITISFGTLTFIKPVIKDLRLSMLKTNVLQIPLKEVEGKFSYDEQTKIEMFKTIYNNFSPFHKKVYFYLCMEPANIWKDTLGTQYDSNEIFEKDMIENYFKKINS